MTDDLAAIDETTVETTVQTTAETTVQTTAETTVETTVEAEAPPSPPVRKARTISLSESCFADFAIPAPVLRGLDALGFTYCTPIQAKTLPHSLQGQDIAGQAQTGTGKTAAFLVTIFKELLETERSHPTAPRAVIVAPTRELALQIASDAADVGKFCHFQTVAVFGGVDWERQAKQLEGKVDLLVGTPGRMMDYMRRKMVDLRHVQVAVLDEADRMFDMGFVDDVRFILGHCSQDRQTLLFSATLGYEVMHLAKRHTRDVVEIRVDPDHVAAESVEQELWHVRERDKLPFLLWLLEDAAPKRCLVFVNTKKAGEWLDFKLYHNGWEAQLMSGDVAQKKRMKIVDDFRKGSVEVLVATDVAARGLHVDDVELVVNFDLPGDPEDYVHRIGRTGRAGQLGRAVSLADESLVENLPAIERYLGTKIASQVATSEQMLADLGPSFGATMRAQRSTGAKKDRPPPRRRR
ncbi:MAG: DEAD/DEAH box helicase [Myxococcales bacterium]|nr:DEAD/DEAH box helicase [Myxococcales bacterium]